MSRRKKAPPQTLGQLREGEGYYSAGQREAVLDSLKRRGDFKPKAFLQSGGLGKTFTDDFFGCVEAEAHFYIESWAAAEQSGGRRNRPPSRRPQVDHQKV